MFVTIKIIPQSTYALISFNEYGKVGLWTMFDLSLRNAFSACGVRFYICLYSECGRTIENDIPTSNNNETKRSKKIQWKSFSERFGDLSVRCYWTPLQSHTVHSWKFYYTPMRINGTFNQFRHTTNRKKNSLSHQDTALNDMRPNDCWGKEIVRRSWRTTITICTNFEQQWWRTLKYTMAWDKR